MGAAGDVSDLRRRAAARRAARRCSSARKRRRMTSWQRQDDEAWLDPRPRAGRTHRRGNSPRNGWYARGSNWAQEHRVVLAMHDIEDYRLPELATDYGNPARHAEVAPAPGACQTAGAAGRGTNKRGGPCMKREGRNRTSRGRRRLPDPATSAAADADAGATCRFRRARARPGGSTAACGREVIRSRLACAASRHGGRPGPARRSAAPSAAALTFMLLRPVDTTESSRPQLATDAARDPQRRGADRFGA